MIMRIFTGPDPASNLDELLRHTPLSRGGACFVVPDSRSRRMAEHRIAVESGGGFVGHRVHTMESLAEAVVATRTSPPAIIGDHGKRALLGEICRIRIGERSRWRSIRTLRGFVTLCASLIEDMRGGNAALGSSVPDFKAIAASYASHLSRNGMTDHEGMVSLALRDNAPEKFSGHFRGPLVIHGFYDFTGMQFRLIERLSACFSRTAVTLPIDHGRSSLFALSGRLLERFLALGGQETRVPHHAGDSTVSGVLAAFHGGPAPPEGDDGELGIHTFRSVASEADWVAGEIRRLIGCGSCRPEDIMMICRGGLFFGEPLERALRRHGLPVEEGLPRLLVSAPSVRFVLTALSASVAVLHDESAAERVQSSSFFGHGDAGPEHFFDPPDERAWSCMFAENDTPEGYVSSLRRMMEHLAISYAGSGGPPDIRRFSEAAALERLDILLDEFAAIYTPFRRMMKRAEFERTLREFLAGVSIPDRPSNAGVLVADVNHARYTSRDVVFMTGLQEGAFPANDGSHPLHSGRAADTLREKRRAEEPLLFLLSAAGAKRLVLTFPGIDDEHSDNRMSPFLREISESVAGWCPPEYHRRLPGSDSVHGSPTVRGWRENMIRRIRAGDDVHGLIPALRGCGEHEAGDVESAVNACLDRLDGFRADLDMRGVFGAVAHEWGEDRKFSVTMLDDYLQCPVSFFFKRLMGLDADTAAPGEIDPLTRGSMVHGILRDFFQERVDLTGSARFGAGDVLECIESIRAITERVFTEGMRGISGVHPVVRGVEYDSLIDMMEAFVRYQAHAFEERSVEPAGFEVPFGFPDGYDAFAISGGDCVVLLRGMIDRIDRSGDDGENLVIIDYKTGGIEAKYKDLMNGAVLQLPLYLDAARNVMFPGAKIGGAFYLSLRDMEEVRFTNYNRPMDEDQWEEAVSAARMNALSAARAIRSGSFPLPENGCGRFCAFRPFCRWRTLRGNGEEA